MGRFAYSWRDGCDTTLLVDGDRFFPAMLAAIDAASESVVLVNYLVEPGACLERFAAALTAAAGRGVEVYVLADRFGAYAARDELKQLADAKVNLAWFNPARPWPPRLNLFRDHRKLLMVDGATGFIGGFCITDDFDPASSDQPWHDLALRLKGPVVSDMHAEFAHDWQVYAGGRPELPTTTASAGQGRCRLLRNHPLQRREIRHRVASVVAGARHRAWIATPYFAPSFRLLRELRRAARRGVDTRLLLSGTATDQPLVRSAGWRFYGRLLRDGVRIFEYQERCLHMKAQLIDDLAAVGSCNLDHWGMRWNRDAQVETTHAPAIASLQQLFTTDFAASKEITSELYRDRSLGARLSQRFSALIDAWLVRSAYRGQLRAYRAYRRAARRSGR
ncbi:MAG: phosphatidylserine/phosphatidylglycerophosphate/cardiolipin synthase family protein [Gammaproteobacteria bacterium]|nr:phosphatidylserine/phosphatidylglycerophosphate/cardiolipin synthase family protein [Gammaproteobacteria bacterium]NNF61798.1 phosphatidylserine/phosphatidylglycerophosphate/cardiolipin synthase family protein [Gammaproteobacteria bacterium]NNM19722.1 phosphatidylserine/phosphatidylglycerophosphate/cardiolipin synthase family protein [Gammaproteobacteria bacterium]